MRTLVALTIVAFALTLHSRAWAISAEEVTNPRPSGGWVSDHAGMLSSADEDELNRMITVAEAESGAEIAVVTVDTVDTATPKDFATELFNLWGIGKRGADNGLLVLMVKSERRLEMETGYGTETVLPDGWLKKMQERDMVPRFKDGEFGEGIKAGVAICIARLREYKLTGKITDPGDKTTPLLLGLLGGTTVLGGGGWAVRRRRWKKQRTCVKCQKMMAMLSEEEDDQHLSPGQLVEEQIGSVDWEYWYCDDCQTHALLGVEKFFSGYTRCSSCRHKTLSTTTNTVVPPTRHSSGLAEVITVCAHCNRRTRNTRVLPRLPEPSSSSSSSFGGSSGGSFGGGSSGGGGAGSSW